MSNFNTALFTPKNIKLSTLFFFFGLFVITNNVNAFGNQSSQSDEVAVTADNLSGAWLLESGTPRRGVRQQLLNLVHIDDIITGDFNGTPLDITFEDGELSFTITRNTPLGSLELKYTGIVEGRRMYGDFSIMNGPNAGKKEKWTATKLNAEVSGRWLVGFSTPWSGAQEEIMVLDQIGDFALGDFNGDPVDAIISGDNISFRLSKQTPIGELSIDYEGLVEGSSMYGSFKILDGPNKGRQDKWSASKLNIAIGGDYSIHVGTMEAQSAGVELSIEQGENASDAVGMIDGVPVVIFVNGENISFSMTSKTDEGIVQKEFTGFLEGDNLFGDFVIKNGPSAGSKHKWKAMKK